MLVSGYCTGEVAGGQWDWLLAAGGGPGVGISGSGGWIIISGPCSHDMESSVLLLRFAECRGG